MLELLVKYRGLFLQGALYTIGLSFVSVLMGILIGLVLAFFRLSKAKILNLISTAYIELIRGTPLLAQIMLVKFGLYDLITAKTKISIPDIAIGIIAVSLNSGAYVCEIIRSGISSVDKGQMEAGLSIGLTPAQTIACTLQRICHSYKRNFDYLVYRGYRFVLYCKCGKLYDL